MDPLQEIRYAAIGLRTGENISIDCPFCRGGTNRDRRTCSIGRMVSGALVYVCHRVKCKEDGRIDSNGSYRQGIVAKRPEFVPRVYSGAIEELPDEAVTYLADCYGIRPEASRTHVGWDSNNKRTIWQIAGPNGAVRGYELRHLRPSARQGGPKSVSYRHSESPWIGYYPHTSYVDSGSWVYAKDESQGLLIVVEDVVSALKVSEYTGAASLMGTSLTVEKVQELTGRNAEVILALDRDATEKARCMIQRYAFLMPGIRMLPLQKDMKYWSGPEIEELVYIGENLKTT